MVKIIIEGDRGVNYKYYFTCKHCGTEFVCDVEDTILTTKEIAYVNDAAEFRMEVKNKKMTEGRAINCPLCNKINMYSSNECLKAKEEYLSNYFLSDGKKVYL